MLSEKTDSPIGPRLTARRLALLEAAAAVFQEKGYANTTLDDIIARSGGSRRTLYSLFGGKQGLFEAIIAEKASKIFAPFHAEDLLDRAPHEMLLEIGIQFLETSLKPDALGTYKLIVAESGQMKELVERFWEMGGGRVRALLASYFEQQTQRGRLRLQNPEQAAYQFLGMLTGSWQLRCLLGLRETPDTEEISSYVRASVDCFLNGCSAKKDKPVSTFKTPIARPRT